MLCYVEEVCHINRIVAKRSVFFCVYVVSFALSVHKTMKYGTFRYDMAEMETSFSNSFIIREASTEKINTMEDVWKSEEDIT